MHAGFVRGARAAALALAAAWASAAFAQAAAPAAGLETWPLEITHRPLTLARGMVEVSGALNVQLSDGSVGQPISIAPSVYVGVTDRLTVGVRHFVGLCVTGAANGCPSVYDDLSLDALVALAHGGWADLAAGAALNLAPLHDPALGLSGEGRLVARFGAGPVALAVVPTLSVGFTGRDDPRIGSIGFPLATTLVFGAPYRAQNREVLAVPASLELQLVPQVAAAVSAALVGALDPTSGTFFDHVTGPLGFALLVAPSSRVDVGGSFTFLNLFGSSPSAALRALQGFVALRF